MSDADDPTESTFTAEPVDDAPVAEATSESAEPTAADPVRTVTRKGAAVGMAGALLAGGLIGWLGAGAFDDDSQPISAFPRGGFSEGHGPGGMPGGGFPGPGGGFPGGEHGPGGEWDDEGDRPTPPWMDDDGDDRRDEYDDGSEDQDDAEDRDQGDDRDRLDDDTDEQGNRDQSDGA
jgi:hypothetical protein